MSHPIYQIDAFTDRLFAGNPAAVVPLERWPEDALMQAVAAENNLSETAFFVPSDGEDDVDYRLRWFTPVTEVDLCGHATLATGWLILNRLDPTRVSVRFQSMSGPLTVARDGERVALDFPARPATEVPRPVGAIKALGARPESFHLATKAMAVFAEAKTVREAEPDLDWIARLPSDGLILTAPGDEDGIDFVSRYFAPRAGIPEDPVTGSAHCTLVPYWAERLGRARLEAAQVSARGGRVSCRLDGDRVFLSGLARLYLEGRIDV